MVESILVVCDNNSILSPMAEAFLRRYGYSSFKVYSVGIDPRAIHLYTFRVMEEIGYELSGYRAKSIFEMNHLQRVDYLITLTDYVNDHFIYNEEHVSNHLHWPFRMPPAIADEQDPASIPDTGISVLDDTSGSVPQPGAHSLLLATRKVFPPFVHTQAPNRLAQDKKELLKQFRKVRNEMECQVMNWLEEKGIGPLWWHR